MLCAPGPVASVPAFSLEPEFRRSHGSLYKALTKGRIDEDRLRRLLVATAPEDWPLVFAVDASTWIAATPSAALSVASTTRRPSTRRSAHRRRVELPVDQPALLGAELVDRPARRDAYPAHRGHDNGDDRSGPPPRRPARDTDRSPVVRVRRRLRPDRHRPRTRRDTSPDPVPHPRRPRLPHRSARRPNRPPDTGAVPHATATASNAPTPRPGPNPPASLVTTDARYGTVTVQLPGTTYTPDSCAADTGPSYDTRRSCKAA